MLPNFLIIGAMKSGTTSLYADLRAHPGVFMPDDKEPACLAHDAVLSPAGRADYERLFRDATDDQLCGEASTAYTKLPDYPGVAERASATLGDELKMIYIVREPVSRVISQHYHELSFGRVNPSFDTAVREQPHLVDYSRYAMQIEPWLDRFGRDRIQIISFERYVAARRTTVDALFDFLGLERVAAADLDGAAIHNSSAAAVTRKGLAWRFGQTSAYRRWIRPRLSGAARSRLIKQTMPEPPERPPPPRLDTIDFILEAVSGDAARIAELAGSPDPFWDLAAVRQSHVTS